MSTLHDWVPATQFAEAQGARLAYQLFGDGEHRIVAIPPLAQNIEIAWEQPAIRAMHERFASFSRFLVFDKRGTGASDRHSEVPGIDERVEDIRAVMDAAGFESGHLFVQSDGGPMAIMFAATYPERVESLIFSGSFAALERPWTEEERLARRERQVAEWGTPQSRVVDVFAPSLAADQEFRTWHQRYERHSASMNSMRDLLDLTAEMDVRELLPTLDVPTLVIHRTGDRIVSLEHGRELAAKIPNARLVEFDSEDHFAYVGDLDPWMTEIERFVTGATQPHPPSHAAPPSANIDVFDRFAVNRGDVEVAQSEWGSRLARQLCKRLVLAGGSPVTRDELIDMLWPDEHDRRKLSARLSVQLSAVRRVLGGGVIADRQTVRLDLGQVSTDLAVFQNATDDAAIVAAYTGELLSGDLYEDWTGPARDAARARFVAAARRLAERADAAGRHLESAQLARRIVAADRYDEAAHRMLIEALQAAGETGAARRAHEAWATAMDELEVPVPAFERPS